MVTVVPESLELPQSDVDGDSTLALGLQLVHDPRILEGSLHIYKFNSATSQFQRGENLEGFSSGLH